MGLAAVFSIISVAVVARFELCHDTVMVRTYGFSLILIFMLMW